MGLRVNKVLGWGLTDMTSNDFRINNYDLFRNNQYSIEGFKKYWESNHINEMEYWLFKKNDLKDISISHCISYDPEILSNVLVITPVSKIKKWQRIDDIIDYQEETHNCNQLHHYQIFDFGIFPWIGSFCNSQGNRWTNTKEKPYHSVASEFIKIKNNKELNTDKKNNSLLSLAKSIGYNTVEEANKNIISVIPEEIQMMCNYLELFKNYQTIYQLRPMIYVFWR